MLSDDTLLAADSKARVAALDVTRSFIVQAPAGSGKTELLIQRYLKLLAIVDHPEEVIAITFTRKAADEMRHRVLAALKSARHGLVPERAHERLTIDAARSVLARDAESTWQLTEFPRRMRIQTLDALGAGIARSLPLSANLGGMPTTLADTEMRTIYRSAAAATFYWLTTADRMREAVEQVLAHLDNNTGIYIEYLARMLETRDQWLSFVGGGPPAAEPAPGVRRKLEKSISDLIGQHLARLRDAMPVHLAAPLLRLVAYAAENIRRRDPEHPLAQLAGRSVLPGAQPACVPLWRGLAELLLTRDGKWRRTVTVNEGFPAGDKGEKRQMLALLNDLSNLDELRHRLERIRLLPPQHYSDAQWQVLLSLFNLLPLAVTELRRIFALRGVVDHIEVALAANLALGSADDPGEMALLLDYQIRHLLVDEMQDTSFSQYHFLEKLVAGWEEGDGRTLFCVGDPMQSIYRFRNAEVGQFLVARDHGLAGLALQPLVLRRNFRSGGNLVHWFNQTFGRTLPRQDDIAAGAIAYAEAVAVEQHRSAGHCRVHPVFGGDPELEAASVLAIVQDCLRDMAADERVAVLVRSRTQLPILLAKLRGTQIPYQAVEIDRLTDLPEIIDILALTRAICHQGDRIAWLAVLRGPWVGLSWTDIHAIVFNDSHSTLWELLRQQDLLGRLSDAAAARVRDFLHTMRQHMYPNATRSLRDRVELAWYALGGPAFLNDRHELENVYRFLEILDKIDTAGTLGDIATLESRLDDERVSGTSGSDCRLQIMTMHRAKGLQFDHVLLYGLGRMAASSEKSVLSWLTTPSERGAGDMIISPVGPRAELDSDPLHRFIELSQRDKDALEQDRLLYVACTRAKQSLHLFGHVALANDGESFRPPPSGSLLRRIWPAIEADFARAFRAGRVSGGGLESRMVRPALRRFAVRWTLPSAPVLPASGERRLMPDGTSEGEVDYYWVGSNARHTGTIVHRWLQKISDGSVTLQPNSLSKLRPVNERWSERLGVPDAEIGDVCDRVDRALRGILDDPQGQWCLYGRGYAELPVTGLWHGRIESVLIDRVRIGDHGVHWIIDYKTSAHEGGDLEGFLRQESERYRAQLRKYRALYSNLVDAPVRTILYFPLLQSLREVPLD